MAVCGQFVGGGDADDAGTHDGNSHQFPIKTYATQRQMAIVCYFF
jgi:hypothetical protein